VVALCACARGLTAQERPKWWNTAWQYRKLVKLPADPDAVCRAWIHAGKRAKPGGSDIRVVDAKGNLLPLRIVHSTAEGRHLIAFGARAQGAGRGAGGEGTGAVYFGNPQAPAVRPADLRRGLVLETRAIPKDADVSSWESARRAIQNAKTVHGLDFTGRAFHGYNPFGPQADYVSIYRGPINCASSGRYRFATMSEDASFLLIDGEPVVQLPGRGHNINRARRGRHSGRVQLDAGRHEFLYVAFAFGGPKRAAAAWIPPGAATNWWEIIPPEAFLPPVEVKPYECEHVRRPVCADFRAQPLNYLEIGRARMVAVQFTSLSTASDALIRGYQWDFGDGQTAAERSPVHVFLAPGPYQVKLTVTSGRRGKDSFALGLDVRPIYHDLDFRKWKKAKFRGWTRDFVPERLPTENLLALREFLHDVEQRRRVFEACVELDKRRAELGPLDIHAVAMDLGQYYLDPLGNWKTAQGYFELALAQCAPDDLERRFDARFHLADLQFHHEGDLDGARSAYEALRRDFPRGDHARRRRALIRIGDILRNQAKPAEALKIYAEAEADAEFAPTAPQWILDGRYRQEIESFIARGDGPRALESLEEWLWLYPTKRRDGYPFVLRLKANMLLRDYQEVRKQADVYIGYADEPDSLPEVHALAGEACIELGEREQARKHWQAVLDRWPESPAVKDAENGLYRLEH